MLRKVTSILFSVAFLLYTVTPSILMIVDESIDISILFSSSEEEEEEKHLTIDVLYSTVRTKNSDLVFAYSEKSLAYLDKKYTKPNLNIISPPPKIPVF